MCVCVHRTVLLIGIAAQRSAVYSFYARNFVNKFKQNAFGRNEEFSLLKCIRPNTLAHKSNLSHARPKINRIKKISVGAKRGKIARSFNDLTIRRRRAFS